MNWDLLWDFHDGDLIEINNITILEAPLMIRIWSCANSGNFSAKDVGTEEENSKAARCTGTLFESCPLVSNKWGLCLVESKRERVSSLLSRHRINRYKGCEERSSIITIELEQMKGCYGLSLELQEPREDSFHNPLIGWKTLLGVVLKCGVTLSLHQFVKTMLDYFVVVAYLKELFSDISL